MRSRRLKHVVVSMGIAVGITAILGVLLFGSRWTPRLRSVSEGLTKAENSACDILLFGRRGELPVPPKIIVIGVDATSVQALQQDWPFPRAWHAQLIRRLKAWGAKVVAFDVVMDLPKGDEGDRELVRACKDAGNVIMGANLNVGSGEHIGTTHATLDRAFDELYEVTQTGLVNTKVEGEAKDSVVRRGQAGDRIADFPFYSLAVLGASRMIGSEPQMVPGKTLRLGRVTLPLDEENCFWINFVGPPTRFTQFSYYQALRDNDDGTPQVPTQEFKDALVFVGATDPLQHDEVTTPYGSAYPGVIVHANVANMLLSNRPLWRWPLWTALLLGGLAALAIGTASVAGRPTIAAVYLAAAVTAYCAVAVKLFSTYNLWIPVVVPLIGAAMAYVGGVIFRYLAEERERKRISSLFSKYVSKEVARELIEDPDASALGNSRKLPVTCLFSDIRGFTSMSERLEPEEVVALLNEYFDKMVGVVFEHRGTLDKYVGDAIMATFGVPKSFGNDAERACRVAVRMREELTKLQQKWASEGKSGMDIGIGINSGEAVVGNIGHHERREFTCIGDTINTASRLESLNKEQGTKVLISESTYQEIKDLGLFATRKLPPAAVKGKAEAIQIYELLGWAAAAATGTEAAGELTGVR